VKEYGFSLEEVRGAFQMLEAHVARQGVDADCLWAIHHAAEDTIRNLAGELALEGDGPDRDKDDLRRAALAARTVEAFDAAVLLVATFDDRPQVEQARNEIDPAWRPSPAGNEAMLAALETYAEKRAGALGRGAARSEAQTFARMEARRVYQRATKG
jgi:hypothetical protein